MNEIANYDGLEIERMTAGEWGKKRAFFDIAVTTPHGKFTIKGCSLVETVGDDSKVNRFVGFPSKESTKEKGKYDDFVWVDKDLRQKINHLAIQHYEQNCEVIPF